MVFALHKIRSNVVLSACINAMYSTCGFPLDSHDIFGAMKEKDLFLYNVRLSGYTRNAFFYGVISLFLKLLLATHLVLLLNAGGKGLHRHPERGAQGGGPHARIEGWWFLRHVCGEYIDRHVWEMFTYCDLNP